MIDSIRSLIVRRSPRGLIGALFLVVCVESLISRHSIELMGDSTWAYELNHRIASENVKDCDVIVLGDSLVSHGVAVNVIEEATGLKGYNLSFSGAQVPASYLLLRAALESGSRPKYVLVDFFPKLLDSDPWFNIVNLPSIANPADCVELAAHARDTDLMGSLLLRRTLPSVKSRESLRDLIIKSLDGNLVDQRKDRLALARNKQLNRGLLIAPDRRSISMPMDDYVNYLFATFHCNALNRIYIDKLMNLAATHQVKVVILLPPYMPSLQEKLNASGFDAKYQAFVKSLVDSYPGLSVVDARRSNYEPDTFIDANHLSYEGALTYSAEISDVLRADMREESLARSRWVEVPAYRKRSVRTKHETFEESRMAVLKNSRF